MFNVCGIPYCNQLNIRKAPHPLILPIPVMCYPKNVCKQAVDNRLWMGDCSQQAIYHLWCNGNYGWEPLADMLCCLKLWLTESVPLC